MKNMKKLASLILALVMVLSLATTAFADETTVTTGTITINDAVPNQEYKVYEIFKLESYVANGAHSYTIVDAWKNFVAGTGAGAAYVTIDNGYVTWNASKSTDADVKAFAAAALAYAKQNSIAASGTRTAPAAAEGATYSTVTFSNLKFGYYLLSSSLGTVCSIDTTNPSAAIQEKNEAPTSNKQVQEDSNNSWGTTNDADIGQAVEYKSTIEVKAGAVNYTFRDTMTSGLTLNADSIKVTVDNTEIQASTNTDDTTKVNYTVKTGDAAGNYTFTIAFDNTWIATQVGKTIVITYSATVNENAVVDGTGDTNTADLEYGNKTEKDSTPDSTTTTKTWKFDVEKFTYVGTGETKTEQKLAGATFTLSKNQDGTNPIKFIRFKDTDGNDTNVYRVAKTDEATNAVTEITTDDTGTFTLKGLDSDTYYLTETAAPTGYNKLAAAIKVTIDSNGNVKKDNDTASLANGLVKVENKSGTELPSTGGMGTTLFYTLGGILMLAAVVLLVTKKRMNMAE